MNTLLSWIWMFLVVAPPLMFLLYVVGIQYQAGGICWVLLPVVLVGWLLDVVLNYSTLWMYTGFDWPESGEYTFSQRMPRLIASGGTVGWLCLMLAYALNALAPKVHINLQPAEPSP